eukprot:166179-Hanusia_phi.AAC.12
MLDDAVVGLAIEGQRAEVLRGAGGLEHRHRGVHELLELLLVGVPRVDVRLQVPRVSLDDLVPLSDAEHSTRMNYARSPPCAPSSPHARSHPASIDGLAAGDTLRGSPGLALRGSPGLALRGSPGWAVRRLGPAPGCGDPLHRPVDVVARRSPVTGVQVVDRSDDLLHPLVVHDAGLLRKDPFQLYVEIFDFAFEPVDDGIRLLDPCLLPRGIHGPDLGGEGREELIR